MPPSLSGNPVSDVRLHRVRVGVWSASVTLPAPADGAIELYRPRAGYSGE